jgi:hypothetical protein
MGRRKGVKRRRRKRKGGGVWVGGKESEEGDWMGREGGGQEEGRGRR